MAAITLSNPTFFYLGQPASDPWVGFTSTDYRIGRYEFTAPGSGANHVQFRLTGTYFLSGSNAEHHDFCFYIGTSPTSHVQADSNSPYTGQLNMEWAADGSNASIFTGEADVMLAPNTKYYVWIFSISAAYSGRYTNYNLATATATVTTSGGAGLVYIDNGSGFDAYQIYIDNGTGWDLYMPYIDNGTTWNMCN